MTTKMRGRSEANWGGAVGRCALTLMMLALVACTNPELAAFNIAHDSPGPIDEPTVLASGELVLADAKLGPMRDALTSMNYRGTIDFHPTSPCETDDPETLDEDESQRPCLTILYEGSVPLLSELVSSPVSLSMGWIPKMPLEIPPAAVEALDYLYEGTAGTAFQVAINIDPSKVHVSRQLGVHNVDEIGLWFPITLEFPARCSLPPTASPPTGSTCST